MFELDTLEFGRMLKRLREDRGISRREFATLCDSSPKTIFKYEQGKMIPRVDSLARIAEVLGVTLDYLVKGGGIDID